MLLRGSVARPIILGLEQNPPQRGQSLKTECCAEQLEGEVRSFHLEGSEQFEKKTAHSKSRGFLSMLNPVYEKDYLSPAG